MVEALYLVEPLKSVGKPIEHICLLVIGRHIVTGEGVNLIGIERSEKIGIN